MKKVKASNRVQVALLLISTALLVILVVLPLGALFVKAFQDNGGTYTGFDNFIAYFSNPALSNSLINTMIISLVTTLIAVVLGFLYAYAITRTRLRGKGFFKFTAMLPLFAPTMMLGIGLVYLFGNKGLVTMAGLQLPLYGPLGIIISEVIFAFPQVVLILYVSLMFADNRLYEAAEVMGASSIKKFFTITLPSVKYGLISAAFVAFTLGFTDFGAPKVVGGNFNVLATDIYKQVVGQQNFSMGAVVGIILMIPAFVSFFVDRVTAHKNESAVTSKTVSFKPQKSTSRDVAFGLYCSVITGLIFVLLGSVALAATVKMWPYDMSFTLDHFLVNSPSTGGISSYFNSLLVAALSAAIGTVFVFLTSYFIEKIRGAGFLRKTTYLLSIIPLALPGLVIGISYIFFFSNPANPLHGLYSTMWILVLANIVHFYSVPFITATSALKKLDKEFELVSESMRIPFYKTMLRVTVPMSLPAILEIVVYFFVNAMVTVSAVVFLYPANFKVASIAIVNMEDAGNIASAAALSVLIIATNVVVRLIYEFVAKRLTSQQYAQSDVKKRRLFSKTATQPTEPNPLDTTTLDTKESVA